MKMCEMTLSQTGLTTRQGAEILETEFEQEWARNGGMNYLLVNRNQMSSKYLQMRMSGMTASSGPSMGGGAPFGGPPMGGGAPFGYPPMVGGAPFGGPPLAGGPAVAPLAIMPPQPKMNFAQF